MVLATREIAISEDCTLPPEMRQWHIPLEALIPAIQNICNMPAPDVDNIASADNSPSRFPSSSFLYDACQLQEDLECSVGRLNKHQETLSKTGLDPFTFIALYAVSLFGTRKDQEKIIEAVEKKLPDAQEPWPFDQNEISPESCAIHEKIMDHFLAPLIETKDGEPRDPQKIVMIVGPFAAGKTEIFKQNYQDSNFLMLDLDVIRDALARAYGYDNVTDEAVVQRFRKESWFVSDEIFRRALTQGLSVVIQTSLHRKDRWLNDPNLLYAKENKIPIEMIAILRPIHDLIFRGLHRNRGVLMSDMYKSLRGMANIKKFVQKFDNVARILVYDFYPLAHKRHGEDTRIYSQQYKDFIEYAQRAVSKISGDHIYSFAEITEDLLVVE